MQNEKSLRVMNRGTAGPVALRMHLLRIVTWAAAALWPRLWEPMGLQPGETRDRSTHRPNEIELPSCSLRDRLSRSHVSLVNHALPKNGLAGARHLYRSQLFVSLPSASCRPEAQLAATERSDRPRLSVRFTRAGAAQDESQIRNSELSCLRRVIERHELHTERIRTWR